MTLKPVVIITYYWPPSGGGGVQRWLKMLKYFPANGWSPHIYTPENPQFEQYDHNLEKDIHPITEVIRYPIWEPYSMFTKKRKQGVVNGNKRNLLSRVIIWIRGNLFVPDPRIFWVSPSVKFLVDYIEQNKIQHIITTGPPHSMHLIGLRLKKRMPALNWIADFRDPWSKWDILDLLKTSRPIKVLHQLMERKVLNRADLILSVSPSWAEGFRSLTTSKVEIITNGYDEEDFKKKEIKSKQPWLMVHMGLLNRLRHYPALWEALNEFSKENLSFRLVLGGMVDEEIKNHIERLDFLRKVTIFLGYLTHQEVHEYYQKADLLLLLSNRTANNKGHLPGKLFEYIGTQKPIIALSGEDSDMSKMINKYEIGTVLSGNDSSDIIRSLRDHRQSTQIKTLVCKQFQRDSLAKQVTQLLNTMPA